MKQSPELKGRKPFNRHFLLILLVFTLALFLRAWGIGWGLPNGLHKFSYHPDELPLLLAALRIDPSEGRFNPAFYNYPSFYIYLTSFGFALTSAWGLVSSLKDVYMIARIIVVLMGAGSVFWVYYAGRRWYGKSAGLIAALITAVVPLSVVHSHYATVDVPAAFWVTACIAAASALKPESRTRAYILAGLLAGLAAGTKYNAGFVIIVPLVACLSQSQAPLRQKLKDRRLWLIPLAAVAGFIMTTPGVILWNDDFRRGFGYELWHAGSGHGFVFVNTGPGWLYTFTSSLLHGFGIPLAVFAVIAVVFAIMKREKADLPLLTFFIGYYMLISFSEVRFSRYAIPLVPVAALLVGRMLSIGFQARFRLLWRLITAVLLIHVLLYTISLDRLFVYEDSRDLALKSIAGMATDNTSVALATSPWFYTPPFSDGFGYLRREERVESAAKSDYHLVTSETDWDTSVLDARPDFVVISDFEKLDAVRARDAAALHFLQRLDRDYQRINTIGDNGVYNPPFLRPKQLPHDMKYMNPTIWLYERKRSNG